MQAAAAAAAAAAGTSIEQTKLLDFETAPSLIDDDLTIPRFKTPIERTSDLLAAFFGMEADEQPFETTLTPVTKQQEAYMTAVTPTLLPSPPIVVHRNSVKSAPINFGDKATTAASTTPTQLHHQVSAPGLDQPSPPADFVDSKDGHIWRAKYCVLEDGVLYFYRNAADGESPEASSERLQQQPSQQQQHDGGGGGGGGVEQEDLSKSPMPRKFVKGHVNTTTNHHTANTTTPNYSNTANVIWEKRVALDCVGAVRSAEFEYGEFAVELLAHNGDRLVLRASHADEMNDWLFQFHRALASFMKNFMDAMGKWSQTHHVVDLHRLSTAAPIINSMMPSPAIMLTAYPNNSLSHGHGRSGLHRRRVNETESPTAPLIQFNIDQPADIAMTPNHNNSGDKRRGNDNDTQAAVTTQHESEIAVGAGGPSEMEPTTPKKYVPPHLRKTLEKKKNGGRWIPPHLRRKIEDEGTDSSLPLTERTVLFAMSLDEEAIQREAAQEEAVARVLHQSSAAAAFTRGGCADPRVASGSIMDAAYKKRKSSKVGKVAAAEAYGCYGGGNNNNNNNNNHECNEPSLRWEVGAVSECGVRNSNEDSFLICSSAFKAFETLENYQQQDQCGKHDPGFFGIFDGHCGNEAARFATERLTEYFYNEWRKESNIMMGGSSQIKDALQKALENLDNDFCRMCVEDGRDWESGSTAIVAAIVDEELVVSSLGDCRAVVCRSVAPQSGQKFEDSLHEDGWTQLEVEEDLDTQWIRATSSPTADDDVNTLHDWYWKEVADVHDPSRPDEKQRIERANGWITTEKEIPISQMQRMDFADEDVVEILKRCFSERYNQSQPLRAQKKKCNAAPQRILKISRVCGELAVSRAIGDRDFKADFNQPNSNGARGESSPNTLWWDCPLSLPYPNDHSRQFKGNLVTSIAETRTLKLSPAAGLIDEFLVLACDGLWDVIDPDDAVRVTRGLLFEKKWPARKAAARLAELAIHLGSSDNITVIVIRFFRETS